MSRPVLTLKAVRSTLHVTVDGRRVGIVHREVVHSLDDDGRKVVQTYHTGIADCRCSAQASVHQHAASDEAAGQWVADHMAVMHAVGAVRGVA